MREIIVKGRASKKSWCFPVNKKEYALTLLEFLESKNMPIASSCSGQGVCRRCIFNNDRLACEEKLKDISFDVEIDYL